MTDVAVVGGGLAGHIAALAARQQSGVDVTLLADEERFRRQSGPIGVLGYHPDREGPVANPFEALGNLPASHPYRTVGTECVREGLALFDEAVGDLYRGASTATNALVPTSFGRVRPTARYPATMAAGVASERRETTLVGFEHLPAFDAPTAAERLEDVVSYRVNGLTVQFPGDDRDPEAMAATLDENPVTADADSAREALAAAVRMYQSGEERIGLPPVLGLREFDAIRAQFEEAFGVPVFEVPMGAPSVPGLRLGRRLDAALDAAGVTVTTAGAESFEARDGRVARLGLEDGTAVEATEVVLATGGLATGGLVSDRSTVTESLLGCHVAAPADRDEWVAEDALGRQPFARFGVETDAALGPLSASGDREFANVRAAGNVLGGFDPAAENSGGGVAIATGYAAGRDAAEQC